MSGHDDPVLHLGQTRIVGEVGCRVGVLALEVENG
jgi:hypothetical protein